MARRGNGGASSMRQNGSTWMPRSHASGTAHSHRAANQSLSPAHYPTHAAQGTRTHTPPPPPLPPAHHRHNHVALCSPSGKRVEVPSPTRIAEDVFPP